VPLLLTTQERCGHDVEVVAKYGGPSNVIVRRRGEGRSDESAPAVVCSFAVVLIILALRVYYLVSTILAVRKIVGGLDKTGSPKRSGENPRDGTKPWRRGQKRHQTGELDAGGRPARGGPDGQGRRPDGFCDVA